MTPTTAPLRKIALVALTLLAATACEDGIGPEDWVAVPDTITLFSLHRGEYQGLPAALDLLSGFHGQRLVVEYPASTGNWDLVLVEDEGRLGLKPSGGVSGLGQGAGIGLLAGESFESVTKVPGDQARYQDSTAVALEPGKVYAVRSRVYNHFTGQRCAAYGKLSPILVDGESGVVEFEILRNPNCNDRSMIPPKSSKR